MPSSSAPVPADAPPFDNLIASTGRLRILAALAAEPRLEFVQLRRRTRLTDGNLCTHARRLESAGFIAIEKEFRARKPVTHVRITPQGREALERHARELLEALGFEQTRKPPSASRESRVQEPQVRGEPDEDDWVD